MTTDTKEHKLDFSGHVVLIGAREHRHAANRLRSCIPEINWISSNGTIPAGVSTLTLESTNALDEGSFEASVSVEDGTPHAKITGGPFSGVIYGVEELIEQRRYLSPTSTRLTVPTGRISPDLAYRTFWTWDHSTNWNLDQIGQQEIGVFNSYGKPPQGFLGDYERLVDFCSENRIGGAVVYGFLRDSHGGIEAAQSLCKYANERGVRIIPGIAIGAYGGVYWEGPSKYNLSTWLRDHPTTEASAEGTIGFQIEDLDFPLNFPRSDYTKVACPSDPATMNWMEEAVSWLSDTFDIGGVNIESGDYGVCGCDRCVRRRGGRDDPSMRQELLESWSHADLTDNFPRLFETIRSKRPDAWVYCELQWDNLLDIDSDHTFDAMPDSAIYQHTVNRTYWKRVLESLRPGDLSSFAMPRNALRTHIASQWSGDARTERYRDNSRDIMGLARDSAGLGFNGLTIWGEASAHHVPVELNYLAFSRFGFNASLEWDEFFRETVSPLFGGQAQAEEFLDILASADSELSPAPTTLETLSSRVNSALREASDNTIGRWVWLAEHIRKRRRTSSGQGIGAES